MKILVNNAGKRFNRDWIFRNLQLEFSAPHHYAITGHNGSGKSTFLQCIAGSLHLNEGNIELKTAEGRIEKESAYRLLSLAAPYLELIEEMTATEFLDYHASFKPFLPNWDAEKILEYIGLKKAAHKQIRYYSSGMKQRVKLAQAFFSDTPLLLLDEPCSNLDQMGFDLYKRMISGLCANRLVIICSNDPVEYESCSTTISMSVQN